MIFFFLGGGGGGGGGERGVENVNEAKFRIKKKFRIRISTDQCVSQMTLLVYSRIDGYCYIETSMHRSISQSNKSSLKEWLFFGCQTEF